MAVSRPSSPKADPVIESPKADPVIESHRTDPVVESPKARPVAESPKSNTSVKSLKAHPYAESPKDSPKNGVSNSGPASPISPQVERAVSTGSPIDLPITRRQDTSTSRASVTSHQTGRHTILRTVTAELFTPAKPIGESPGYGASFKAALFNSWVNVLLVFIPVGWALHFAKKEGHDGISDTLVFVMNVIAIIPLAGMLGFLTEEISKRLGETLGGLVNATLGNVVELIVAILALVKCEIDVVQSSLVGSILSNILLVLGMCFFAGGVRFSEQTMKTTAAQLNCSLLLISVVAVLIPSAFHFAISSASSDSHAQAAEADSHGRKILTLAEEAKNILSMSHGVAILLLVLYISFMLFQMWSHAHLYADEEKHVNPSARYAPEIANAPGRIVNLTKRTLRLRKGRSDEEAAVPVENGNVSQHSNEEAELEIPKMNVVSTLLVMAIVGGLVGVTAEFFVDSINGMVEDNPSLSRAWVGLILIPIVGNAAEHFAAVTVSVKDKIDLSISVAIGSSIQIALFVTPVISLLAWCINKPLTLLFDPFQSVVLFLSVIVVNQTIADGRSNWMEGLILILFYIIIAISVWFYPGTASALESVLVCK